MRENIIDFFKKGIFPFKGNVSKTKEEKGEEKAAEKSKEKIEKFINDGIIFIKEKSRDTNNDLFKTYFNFSTPSDLAKNCSKKKIKRKTVSL